MSELLKKICFRLQERLFGGRWLKQPAFNVCGRSDADPGHRALLVYLVRPFRLSKNHPAFRHHQNLRQATQIAAVLDSFGYTVDVVDLGDRQFRPERTYDLLINHRVDYDGLEPAIGPRTLKIYLSSGMNHIVHNQNQQARVKYFTERKGRDPKDLIWDREDMPYLKIADALVGFGNEFTMASWRSAFPGPTYAFGNYSLEVLQLQDRDLRTARSHFLFFGSRQQVGKGLDLLLDVFPQLPHFHLHICARYKEEKDFCDCYARELFHTPNIHTHGFVDIGGRTFRNLISRCAFVLHPTCSDAAVGSVVNAMATGLIPIVSREAGLDVEASGFTLRDCRIETIAETVQAVSGLPAEQLVARSAGILKISHARYSQARFIERWKEIMAALSTQAPRPVTL
jgi:glycosyltransferase involved in cell wall biosynthesis